MNSSKRQRVSSVRMFRKDEAPVSRSEQRRERRRAQLKGEQSSNVVQLKVAPQPVAKVQPDKGVKPRKTATSVATEVDIVAHVGKRIQLRRNQMNWSRETMAGKLKGVSIEGLKAIERGQKEISATLLFRFSVELKVPVSFFYEGLPGFVNPIPAKMRAAVQALQATLR